MATPLALGLDTVTVASAVLAVAIATLQAAASRERVVVATGAPTGTAAGPWMLPPPLAPP
jgi:hypothetical protein